MRTLRKNICRQMLGAVGFCFLLASHALCASPLDGYIGRDASAFCRQPKVKSKVHELLKNKSGAFRSGRKKEPLEEIFYEYIAGPVDAVERLQGNNFFASGFRPHSAHEMALIASDQKADLVVVGILHYFPDGPKIARNPVLQLYSRVNSLLELPEPIRTRIDKFKSDFELHGKKFADMERRKRRYSEKYLKTIETKVQEIRLN